MKKKKNIVFLGDSLTEFFDWQARFPEHEVENIGIAGETVQGLLGRMDRIISRDRPPDLLFIMTGINNIAMEDHGIMKTYKKILHALSSSFPTTMLVVQSILPVLLPWTDNRVIEEINTSLAVAAGEFGAVYLDIYSLFIDKQGKPDAACLLDDGVHLSNRGYEVWSKAVEEFIAAHGQGESSL